MLGKYQEKLDREPNDLWGTESKKERQKNKKAKSWAGSGRKTIRQTKSSTLRKEEENGKTEDVISKEGEFNFFSHFN